MNTGSGYGNATSALRLPMRLSPTSARRPSYLRRLDVQSGRLKSTRHRVENRLPYAWRSPPFRATIRHTAGGNAPSKVKDSRKGYAVHRLELTSEEMEALRPLVEEAAPRHGPVEDERFLDEASTYAQELPRRLRWFLNTSRVKEPSGVCVVSDYPARHRRRG